MILSQSVIGTWATFLPPSLIANLKLCSLDEKYEAPHSQHSCVVALIAQCDDLSGSPHEPTPLSPAL